MKKILRKLEKKIGLFRCPVCKNKCWTKPTQAKVWVQPLQEWVISNNKNCRLCKKVLKLMVKKM